MSDIFEFDLGDRVKDSVTGYKGTITGRYEYVNGCIRYTVESFKEGDIKDFVFDEDRLDLVKGAKREPVAVRTGGPRTAPPR